MMQTFKLISMVTLLGAGCSAAFAGGTDGKTYPGAMCRTENGNAGISRNLDGGIYNYSTVQSRKIYCPVVHDDLSFRSGFPEKNAAITFARVRVVDQNNGANQDVFCSIYKRYPGQNGNFMTSLEFEQSSGASAEVQHLDMISTSKLFYTYSFFAVGIECVLPPARWQNGVRRDSGLVSYMVYERAL